MSKHRKRDSSETASSDDVLDVPKKSKGKLSTSDRGIPLSVSHSDSFHASEPRLLFASTPSPSHLPQSASSSHLSVSLSPSPSPSTTSKSRTRTGSRKQDKQKNSVNGTSGKGAESMETATLLPHSISAPKLSLLSTSRSGLFASQSTLVQPHLDWFVEEPSAEVEVPVLVEYKHAYARNFASHSHLNFILTLSDGDKKEQMPRAILSVARYPEKGMVNKFVNTGNTHRALIQHENGCEETLFHNVPSCASDDEFQSKMRSYLKDFMPSKENGFYAITQNPIEVQQEILKFEEKHSRLIRTMKIAVLYAKPGQTNMSQIWSNQPPKGSGFYQFLDGIADEIDVAGFTGYKGDMGSFGQDASSGAYYRHWNGIEIIFHIAPWMDEEQHRRLIGNDTCFLIYYDVQAPSDECKGSSENSKPTKSYRTRKSNDPQLITTIVRDALAMDAPALQAMSKSFFAQFFEKDPDARDYFEDTTGLAEWRLLEMLKKMLELIARTADGDPTLSTKTFGDRRKFYEFLSLGREIFETYVSCLIQVLKSTFPDVFTKDHETAWQQHMKYLTRLLLGETEWAPKKTSEGFVPFDANALGNLPQVFGVVEPHPTTEALYRLAFFSRPAIGPFSPLTPPSKHYFTMENIANWLYTKFHNGIFKANTVPPLDRLFSIPRREAIRTLAEKFPPSSKSSKDSKLRRGDSHTELSAS